MADKIYVRDSQNSFVYEKEANKWKTEEMLNLKKWENACVVDDVLYYYDFFENSLRWYDPKKRWCGVVKGLEELLAVMKSYSSWSETDAVFYGGTVGEWLSFSLKQKKEQGRFGVRRFRWKDVKEERFWGKVEWFALGIL